MAFHVHNLTTDQHRTTETEDEALQVVTEPTDFVGEGDDWTIARMPTQVGAGAKLHSMRGPIKAR